MKNQYDPQVLQSGSRIRAEKEETNSEGGSLFDVPTTPSFIPDKDKNIPLVDEEEDVSAETDE